MGPGELSGQRQTESGANGIRHWLRVLRPLFWWALFVLFLFGVRTHQQLSERTKLLFSASLQGRSVSDEVSAQIDGKPILSGSRVAIGRHTFTISHPKAETFSTNVFLWYGPHQLGEIDLRRGTGLLSVEVTPPARLLTIRGPEFELMLTNSPGVTSSVPTDAYVIEATYAH